MISDSPISWTMRNFQLLPSSPIPTLCDFSSKGGLLLTQVVLRSYIKFRVFSRFFLLIFQGNKYEYV